MKNNIIIGLFALLIIASCNKDKEILNNLADYNTTMESKGYHFGDDIILPKKVTENAENITISFGDKESNSLKIEPKYYTLGDNAVTFVIKKKNGEMLNQDATINVFAKNPEANLTFTIVKEYPHNNKSFTEGILLEGNTVYESAGQVKESRIMKYTLGKTTELAQAKQPDSIFSEGITIFGNKIYQLTWKNKIIFTYDKNTLKLLGQYTNPNVMGEGWGLTTDGKSLIASDGTKNIYFLDPNNPSKLLRYISVAGNKEVYDQVNELEYHNGFIYSNVWHKPIILKINPANGEVLGKFDFTDLVKQNEAGDTEKVLNGIAFNGDNMLITGKNWSKIFEISIK